jgi:hypothetical protein
MQPSVAVGGLIAPYTCFLVLVVAKRKKNYPGAIPLVTFGAWHPFAARVFQRRFCSAFKRDFDHIWMEPYGFKVPTSCVCVLSAGLRPARAQLPGLESLGELPNDEAGREAGPG